MKRFTELTIKSSTNVDYNGSYKASDIGEEMDELGLVPAGNEWIEYVIGHFDFPAEIDDMVCNDMVLNLTANINGDIVNFIKK